MGHFPQDGESGQNVDFFIFWSSAVTKWFDFFNFSRLAHLEPELELFEVDDIGNDGDDDL